MIQTGIFHESCTSAVMSSSCHQIQTWPTHVKSYWQTNLNKRSSLAKQFIQQFHIKTLVNNWDQSIFPSIHLLWVSCLLISRLRRHIDLTNSLGSQQHSTGKVFMRQFCHIKPTSSSHNNLRIKTMPQILTLVFNLSRHQLVAGITYLPCCGSSIPQVNLGYL